MDQNTQQQARARVQEVVQRIKGDPNLARQAQTDPVGTLTGAGMPEEAIGDFLREEGIEAEVSGYAACTITCACTPCCLSGSCWVTV